MLHVLCAKLSGARVIMSEPDAERRALAKTLGCDDTINPMETNPVDYIKNLNGIGAEAVFNTTPISAVAKQAVEMTAPLGRCVMYSSQHPDKPIEISPNWLHSSETVITGAVSPSIKAFQQAVLLIGKRIIDPSILTEQIFDYTEFKEAMEVAMRPDTYKVILKFGDIND